MTEQHISDVTQSPSLKIDMCRLLEMRLWVARLGEGDVLNWWRTEGVLGPDGAFVGPRVLPKTHPTGRARIAFAVARHACRERYPDDNALHLFRLDPWTEDAFDAHLHDTLGDLGYWREVMEVLEAFDSSTTPAKALLERGLVTESALSAVAEISLGPDDRSLRLTIDGSSEDLLEQMTAGFARDQPRALVVPYVPAAEWRNHE